MSVNNTVSASIDQQFVCNVPECLCGKYFKTKNSLRDHKSKVLKGLANKKEDRDDNTHPFKCDWCPSRFTRKDHCVFHMKSKCQNRPLIGKRLADTLIEQLHAIEVLI